MQSKRTDSENIDDDDDNNDADDDDADDHDSHAHDAAPGRYMVDVSTKVLHRIRCNSAERSLQILYRRIIEEPVPLPGAPTIAGWSLIPF